MDHLTSMAVKDDEHAHTTIVSETMIYIQIRQTQLKYFILFQFINSYYFLSNLLIGSHLYRFLGSSDGHNRYPMIRFQFVFRLISMDHQNHPKIQNIYSTLYIFLSTHTWQESLFGVFAQIMLSEIFLTDPK